MNALSEQIYDSLMVSCCLPRDELEDYTHRALATIVGHAQATVPFYGDRLAGVVGPDGALDMEAWHRVPPLTRDDAQSRFEDLKSVELPDSHGEAAERSTSGTTGKPVTVLVTERTRCAEIALMGRRYGWARLDPAFNMVIMSGNRHPLLRYYELIPEPWVPFWMRGGNPGGYARMHHPMEAEEQLAFLATQGPIYFNTQPSNFRRVIHAVRDGRGPRPDIRGLISLGETVTADDRSLAGEVLGCTIHDSYSATDVGTIASQCSHGNLHVNSEIIRVDAVRADGTPCEPEEPGRLLLTTLINAAMPMVRYEIGDIGALGGACGCGLSLPVLTLTVGRERQLFRFGDGTTAMPLFRLEKHMEIFPVLQWQLVQVAPEIVELRFRSGAADDELQFEAITEEIRRSLGRPLDVRFRRSEKDMTGPTGKLEPVIRRYD